ncbi:MAG: dihydroorotate dehydrogenase electron transfer subunit [Anaerovoracaceae bacterium]
MNKGNYTILENYSLAESIYKMVLSGDTREITNPGQFINIKLEGFYLRRPISISQWEDGEMTIIYKAVGQGTKAMAKMTPGQILDVLCPLGNGYDLTKCGISPVVIGGGVGVPPMYALTKKLVEKGINPKVILGFNSKKDVFYEEEFKNLGGDVKITTVDGSYGTKGFVTDAMGEEDYAFACGPEAMLQGVFEKVAGGQFSFESRMACGFGGCMGCSCETKYGAKRICKDGPVLVKEEIIW